MKVTKNNEAFIVQPEFVETDERKAPQTEIVVSKGKPVSSSRHSGALTTWEHSIRGVIYLLVTIDAVIIGLLLNYWLFDPPSASRSLLAPTPQTNAVAVDPIVSVPDVISRNASSGVVAPNESNREPVILLSNGFACPPIQNKTTMAVKDLRILTFGKRVPADVVECFERSFQVEVEVVSVPTTEEFKTTLTSANSSFDLVLGAEHFLVSLIGKKHFQALDHSLLPVLKRLNPVFLNQQFDPANKFTLPYQSGTVAIVYDTEAIKTPPTSWKDLWDPAYVGRVSIPNDSRMMVGIALSTLSLDVNSKVQSRLERTREPLTQLLESIGDLQSTEPLAALLDDTADIGVLSSADAQRAKRLNPALAFVYPQEGAFLWQNHYAILAASPNRDSAYAWLNYTMQDDLFWLVLRDVPSTIANDAALAYARQNHSKLYDEYINSSILSPQLDALTNGKALRDTGDFTDAYVKLWSEVLATSKLATK